MKNILKKVRSKLNKVIFTNYFNFSNSRKYWEERYQIGKNSGPGSYGQLAIFKANIINELIDEHLITSAIEFGCGDGNQLSLINFKDYTGIDVSSKAIGICKNKFKNDPSKKFLTSDQSIKGKADMTLSLDVIYHLVEDKVFFDYMDLLFSHSDNLVVIYSSNFEDNLGEFNKHIKHRVFESWIDEHRPDFYLISFLPNKYPYNGNDDTSFANFYIYQKK